MKVKKNQNKKNIFLTFKNKELLTEALTHSSWLNENKKKGASNERLEFLGDAVIELIVSEYLYKRYPKKDEGFLTSLRSHLVNTHNLSKIARKLNLGKHLLLSKGEEKGRNNPSLLADSFEALVGALYLDQGFKKAYEFLKQTIFENLKKEIKNPPKDPKSYLQELSQKMNLGTPTYKVVKETGPDHSKSYEVIALIQKKEWGRGIGHSKQEASQIAAKKAIKKFKILSKKEFKGKI